MIIFLNSKLIKSFIKNRGNLKIINDSKSTSFSSTTGLLSTYKNIHWIVGGMFKKGDKFSLDKKYYKNINAYIYLNIQQYCLLVIKKFIYNV